MLYSLFFTFTVAAVLSLQQVAAIPLDVKFGDGQGSKEDREKIESAMPLVNQKIKNMKAVIDLPDAKTHPAVVKAFGANANVEKIKKNVNTLQTSKIMVPHTDAADGVTQGATLTTPEGYKHIKFGSAFYLSDENTRAGTIIHEATHAKANTVDHFKTDGTPGTRHNPGVRVGYKDSHMSELNAKHSDQMHHNADAYRVFGDECPHVRRSLYRRAMEESHPVVHSELLRRAAHACAWKPKGKDAPASAKSVAKGSGFQKSVSAKKPLSKAGSAKSVHKVTSKHSPFSGAKKLTKVKAEKAARVGTHSASQRAVGGKATKVKAAKTAHAGAHPASKRPAGGKANAHAQAKPKAVQHVKAVAKAKPAQKSAPRLGTKRVTGKKH